MSKATIKIPRPLYNRLRDIIEDTGFSSVTEFVVYVLRDLAAAPAWDDDDPPVEEEAGSSLTREEIAAIKKRLRALGYLDEGQGD